jgi:O-antigen ligase
MFAALVVSLSRSAAIGAVAAAVCGGLIAIGRHGRKSRGWLALAAVLAVAIAASLPVSSQLLARFDNAKGDTGKRVQIWRETIPIVRDFPLTGVGLGAYRMAMIVYQRSDRAFFFNDAHDEYLQFAAEGGLLLGVPLALAALAAIVATARRLREDDSTGFWIRGGAVASLAGVAVQSVWETGLEIPANALLFAVICAIAIHEPRAGAPSHVSGGSRARGRHSTGPTDTRTGRSHARGR